MISKVRDSLRRAVKYMLGMQLADGGFPRQFGEGADAWSTAEAILALSFEDEEYRTPLARAQSYLLSNQQQEGSWQSEAYKTKSRQGDVAATSYALKALSLGDSGKTELAVSRGCRWLLSCQKQDGGWGIDDSNADSFSHVGLSGYAISALAFCSVESHSVAESVQRGLHFIDKARLPGIGWPLHPGGTEDATIGCYALRGILDCCFRRNYSPSVHSVTQWLASTKRKQNEIGAWASWYGIESSTEATALVIELVGCLYPDAAVVLVGTEFIKRGIEFIFDTQLGDGGFPIAASYGNPSSVWVTHNVILAFASILRVTNAKLTSIRPGLIQPITGAVASKPTNERYDVSISYSGENKEFADALAFRLQLYGLSVFIDSTHQTDIWGMNLPDLFGNIFSRARYCIVLLSQSYLDRPWSKFEYMKLRESIVFSSQCTILPILMEGMSAPPDFLRSVGYIRLADFRLENIVDMIVQKNRSGSELDEESHPH